MEEKLYSPPFYDIIYDMLGFRLKDVRDMAEIFEGRTSKYVFTSSAAVYSGKSGVLTEEDFDPMNLDLDLDRGEKSYSEGKRRCEAYLFQKAHFPVVVARFPNVLGHDDSTLRFQDHLSRIDDGKGFRIPQTGGKRNYVWVEDAGRFLFWLGSAKRGGAYNAASKEVFQVDEVLRSFASALEKEVTIETVPDAVPDTGYFSPVDYILSTKKAEKEGFVFTPSHEWIGSEVSLWRNKGGVSPNTQDYAKDLF